MYCFTGGVCFSLETLFTEPFNPQRDQWPVEPSTVGSFLSETLFTEPFNPERDQWPVEPSTVGSFLSETLFTEPFNPEREISGRWSLRRLVHSCQTHCSQNPSTQRERSVAGGAFDGWFILVRNTVHRTLQPRERSVAGGAFDGWFILVRNTVHRTLQPRERDQWPVEPSTVGSFLSDTLFTEPFNPEREISGRWSLRRLVHSCQKHCSQNPSTQREIDE